MGEAKRRQQIGIREFHMTRREQFTLLVIVMRKQSASRDERRKRKYLWEELGMVEARDKFLEIPQDPPPGQPAPKVGLDPKEWADNATPVPVRISGPTMEYILSVLDGAQEGNLSDIVGELEDRLMALKDGSYEPPAGIFPPTDVAAT